MNSEYIAYIADQESGPVTYSDLQGMWRSGEISDETNVRVSDQSNWMSWRELRVHMAEENDRMKRQAMAKIPPPVPRGVIPKARGKLREMTFYPVLRTCLMIVLVLSGFGVALSFFALFSDDFRAFGVTGIITSLASIFSTLILGVLLDIADALLAKLD